MKIDGHATWRLPLSLSSSDAEPLPDSMNPGDEAARHEAAYKLISNYDAVVKFCCRGMGERGAKQFGAPLADPTAVPNLNYEGKRWTSCCVPPFFCCSMDLPVSPRVRQARKEGVASCLAYLRDRIGVPRDMSYPAAMTLRAHLNYIIDAI